MKNDFIQALLTVPESVKPWVVGQIASTSPPVDKDSAILQMGILAHNINGQLLEPLVGMDLTQLFLRAGQYNSVLVSMLLSGLELIESGTGDQPRIVSPVDTEEYLIASGLPIRVESADLVSAEAWLFDNTEVKTVLQLVSGGFEDVLTTSVYDNPEVDKVYVTYHVSCVLRGLDNPVVLSGSVGMLTGGTGGG